MHIKRQQNTISAAVGLPLEFPCNHCDTNFTWNACTLKGDMTPPAPAVIEPSVAVHLWWMSYNHDNHCTCTCKDNMILSEVSPLMENIYLLHCRPCNHWSRCANYLLVVGMGMRRFKLFTFTFSRKPSFLVCFCQKVAVGCQQSKVSQWTSFREGESPWIIVHPNSQIPSQWIIICQSHLMIACQERIWSDPTQRNKSGIVEEPKQQCLASLWSALPHQIELYLAYTLCKQVCMIIFRQNSYTLCKQVCMFIFRQNWWGMVRYGIGCCYDTLRCVFHPAELWPG